MNEPKLALGPAISVEQIRMAKRYLQGATVTDDLLHEVFVPVPNDLNERAALLAILDDVLAEVET